MGFKRITVKRRTKKNNLLRVVSFMLLLSFLFSLPGFAQTDTAYTNSRNRLVTDLKKRMVSNTFTQRVDQFYTKSCDSLYRLGLIMGDRPISLVLTRLFEETDQKLISGNITALRVSAVNSYFLQTLSKNQPIQSLYRQIGLSQSSILDYAFDGTPVGDSIDNVVGIREMMSAPFYIPLRIAQPRYASSRDTLLYFLANHDPETLTKKLADHDPLFTELVNKTQNKNVKAVAQIQKDINYDRELPFGMAMLENRIAAADVKKLVTEPELYYKVFVDEAIRLHTDKDAQIRAYAEKPIVALNASLANKFYISEINEKHESPDNVRFAILDKRTPRELYFLMVGGTGELYTSSFLYLFKKFIRDTEKEGLENFFADIDYYQFDQFITNIAGYGLVDDLADHMKPETVSRLLGKSIARLSSSQLSDNDIVLNAMTLSDVLYAIRDRPVLNALLVKQFDSLKTPKVSNDLLLRRLHSGLKDVLVNKKGYLSTTIYDKLPVSRLKKNNTIVQACFYYDDEDGTNSFANSTAGYNTTVWNKQDKGNYIVYVSRQGNMRVYMNKPNTTTGCDTAQNQMLHDLRADGYEPTSYIHRGHSYYLAQSLGKMNSKAQFIFLGACGGYNEVLQLFRLNPDMNIISTRNIGSSQINDPLLQQINSDLVNNKDIVWDDFWKSFDTRFQSKNTKDLFSSYQAPNKYIGIKYIRKVFNY